MNYRKATLSAIINYVSNYTKQNLPRQPIFFCLSIHFCQEEPGSSPSPQSGVLWATSAQSFASHTTSLRLFLTNFQYMCQCLLQGFTQLLAYLFSLLSTSPFKHPNQVHMAVSTHTFLHHNRTEAWLGFGRPERIRAAASDINYVFKNSQ
jgi:hypothetical protein